MSWGERSCLKPCRVPDKCSMETCNTYCSGYIWDGKTPTEAQRMSGMVLIDDPLPSDTTEPPHINADYGPKMNRAERRAAKRKK
jgi:hypothetical protein